MLCWFACLSDLPLNHTVISSRGCPDSFKRFRHHNSTANISTLAPFSLTEDYHSLLGILSGLISRNRRPALDSCPKSRTMKIWGGQGKTLNLTLNYILSSTISGARRQLFYFKSRQDMIAAVLVQQGWKCSQQTPSVSIKSCANTHTQAQDTHIHIRSCKSIKRTSWDLLVNLCCICFYCTHFSWRSYHLL